MSRQFPVKGLPELDRYLSALPGNMQRNAYRSALRRAARPARDRARQLASKRSGKMAKAVKTGSPRQNQDGTFSVAVRLQGEHAYLGYFQEFGVLPHLITVSGEVLSDVEGRLKPLKDGRRRSKQTLMKHVNRMHRAGSLKIGENYIGPMVMHPGHAAHPFMRPALDMEAAAIVREFGAGIRDFLEKRTGFVAPEAD